MATEHGAGSLDGMTQQERWKKLIAELDEFNDHLRTVDPRDTEAINKAKDVVDYQIKRLNGKIQKSVLANAELVKKSKTAADSDDDPEKTMNDARKIFEKIEKARDAKAGS